MIDRGRPAYYTVTAARQRFGRQETDMKITRYDRLLGCLVCLFAGCSEAETGAGDSADDATSTDAAPADSDPSKPDAPGDPACGDDANSARLQ